MSGEPGEASQSIGAQLAPNRRQMLVAMSLGALFATVGGVAPVHARITPARSTSTLSFHRDEPWVDPSGQSVPFHPPRSGRLFADLSDEHLRRLNCYL